MTSAWQKYKEKLGTTRPWDFINPNTPKVSDEQAELRFKVCLQCPKLIKTTNQCKECGCFMKAKVKLKEASCPLNFW